MLDDLQFIIEQHVGYTRPITRQELMDYFKLNDDRPIREGIRELRTNHDMLIIGTSKKAGYYLTTKARMKVESVERADASLMVKEGKSRIVNTSATIRFADQTLKEIEGEEFLEKRDEDEKQMKLGLKKK